MATHLHDFGGVLGGPVDTSLWALTNSWSRLVCEVALINITFNTGSSDAYSISTTQVRSFVL